MNSNNRIIVWTDRPPTFTKTPFLYLAQIGKRVSFFYRRDDNQVDRKSIHEDRKYENCEFVCYTEFLKTKEDYLAFLKENQACIHIINGFYLSPFISHKELKQLCPNSKIYLLTEKPQSFKKPLWLSNLVVGIKSRIKASKNKEYVDGVIAFGEDACSYFVNHGWPQQKVHNFIYSFDFNLVGNINGVVSQACRKFLYVGRFDFEIKGVDYLFGAIKSLDKELDDFEFGFVGGYGKKAEDVLSMIKGNKHCSFIGQLSFLDTLKTISEYDCVVVPSVRDGWNINVLMALCCGKPVIATDGSGSHHLLSRFDYGIIVKKKNGKEFYQAIKTLVEKPEIYLTCRENALKYSKYFSNKIVGEYIGTILDEKECKLY